MEKRTMRKIHFILVFIIVVQILGLNCSVRETGNQPLTTSELFMELPSSCPTPDGFVMDDEGNIIFSCPNFADQTKPAVFMKIDSGDNLSLYAKCPVLEKTGLACPMGIDLGPDGSLYVSDNQGWTGSEAGENEGRILKLTIKDGDVITTEIIAYHMNHPNGVKYHDGKLYVTQSLLPGIESNELVSGVYRFDENDRDIYINNDATDNNLLIQFKTFNMDVQYGLDGLVFDSEGNLFVGNFGDGTLHKITFDQSGNIVSNTVFAQSSDMRTIDGICIDKEDNIYVADFSENAICKVTPLGEVQILARSPDCDGSDGGLDQPGEAIVRGNQLIVSCFDLVTGPDKVNTGHDEPYTLALINLE